MNNANKELSKLTPHLKNKLKKLYGEEWANMAIEHFELLLKEGRIRINTKGDILSYNSFKSYER